MSSASAGRLECAICLDSCLNAVRLDCNHIFCYLCVKGSAQQSNNRCPVCRRPIPADYFDNPNLIEDVEWKAVTTGEGTQWQYEGRNGWWLYDPRNSREIEKAFASNESSIDVLIAGFVYVIDFQQMIQFRRNQPNRIRRIRRHTIDPDITKGVAGLRTNFNDIQLISDSSLPNTETIDESQCLESGDHSEDTNRNIPQIQSIDSNGDNIATDANTGDDLESNRDLNDLQLIFDSALNLRDTPETYL